MMENYSQEELNEAYFVQLVYTFQAAAMQQMGKIVNPITNQVEKNMEQAKHSIDMLAMLEKKTNGNLTEREAKILEKTLFELRMNYVDEMKVTEKEENGQPEEQQEKSGEQQPEKTEEKEPNSSEEKNHTAKESSGQASAEKDSSKKEPSKKESSDKEGVEGHGAGAKK
jgi:hypothetical protein